MLSFTLVTKGKTLCRHIAFSLFRNFYNKLKGYRHKYNQKQPPTTSKRKPNALISFQTYKISMMPSDPSAAIFPKHPGHSLPILAPRVSHTAAICRNEVTTATAVPWGRCRRPDQCVLMVTTISSVDSSLSSTEAICTEFAQNHPLENKRIPMVLTVLQKSRNVSFVRSWGQFKQATGRRSSGWLKVLCFHPSTWEEASSNSLRPKG